MNNILHEKQQIGNFRVLNIIKGGFFNETYKVLDENDNPFFMKIYVMKRVPEKLIDKETSEVREIINCRNLAHKNIISYVASGSISLEIGECHYMVTNYFSGELIAEKIQKEGRIEFEEALRIYKGILEGLSYMHKQSPAIMHNDITPRNIMLSQTANGCPEIIDMGHISNRLIGSTPFETSELDVNYCANETFSGMYSEQSDIFSATAVFYTMLVGKAPWYVELDSNMTRAEKIIKVKKVRKNSLDFEDVNIEPVFKEIIRKGIEVKPTQRYENINEILTDIENRSVKGNKQQSDFSNQQSEIRSQNSEETTKFEIRSGKGNGFDDIAGMNDLKELLKQKVISVMQDRAKAEKYRLTPPNGMLLYGPPGCGKTFFAEKFAEETKFNFILVKASDIASIYVHGTQGKIAELFKQAEQNKPTILCFDEFDAVVPNRSNIDNPNLSGEVNEFLTQLNNCSQRGIFVIATSNRPDKIDPAVLRTGRIDKQVYVPLPDEECRREMFLLHISGRPNDVNETQIDELVKLSEGYVASDIAYVVDDAARIAAYNDIPITYSILVDVIRCTKPSVGKEILDSYSKLQDRMNGIERRNSLPKVGFVID